MTTRYLSGESPKAFEVVSDNLASLFYDVSDLIYTYSDTSATGRWIEPQLLALDVRPVYEDVTVVEYVAIVVLSGAHNDEVGSLEC